MQHNEIEIKWHELRKNISKRSNWSRAFRKWDDRLDNVNKEVVQMRSVLICILYLLASL